MLSEPFLLAELLYYCKQGKKNFDINHSDVQKMLNITKQYMPKLHNKIQTSIKNQKYINGFMTACGYKQDDDVGSFLRWIPEQQCYNDITYDVFKQSFDTYVADIENPKPQQQMNKQNNIPTMIPNDTINNMGMNNNNQIMSNNMENNMMNQIVNNNIKMNNQIITNDNVNNMNNNVHVPQTNEQQTNTYIVDNANTNKQSQEAQFSLCGCSNKYIGYDNDGCHCCCLW